MAVLNKESILKLAKDNKLLGDNYDETNVKGSSYDLRIGTIFLNKEKKQDNIISVSRGNGTIIEVLPSEIITILTHEIVCLPNNVCGTVFPINKHSSQGLLILNPGHIDPGFNGPISICAINLSTESKMLKLDDKIFTIIFDELDEPTNKYKNNTYSNRKSYEDDFYIKRAAKLSSSIFDLITINKYVPILRKQINFALNQRLLKVVKIIFYVLVGIATIFGVFYTGKNYINSDLEIKDQKIKEIQYDNLKLYDSLYFYKKKLIYLENTIKYDTTENIKQLGKVK